MTMPVVSIIIALISLAVAIFSLFNAGKARTDNKEMFKRQGVIELHHAWSGISKIDKDNLISPDIIKAINALSLTASLWMHDVMSKDILHQMYWNSYRTLYDQFYSIEQIAPGLDKTCKDMLSDNETFVYDEMKKKSLNSINSSNI